MLAKEESYKELGRRERREKQLRVVRDKLQVKNQLMVRRYVKAKSYC